MGVYFLVKINTLTKLILIGLVCFVFSNHEQTKLKWESSPFTPVDHY